MDPATWRRAQELFDAALGLHGRERREYLERECDGGRELREQVEALLDADARANGLETRLAQGAAELVGDLEREQRSVGEYRVLQKIGSGSAATVYLAERADGSSRDRVAIRLLERGSDAGVILDRFESLRQSLTSLRHPGFARLLGGGLTDAGIPYFATEYVDGQPLDRFCDEHSLGIEERLELFSPVCDAVAYAHLHDVVHGNLSPSNILVTADRQVKILDAGLAGVIGPTPSSARLKARAYASPEQIRSEPVTRASDVFALGIILYEMLSGSRPFRFASNSPAEIERVICQQDVERPSQSAARGLRRRLLGDLDSICLKALQKVPDQRYPSVEELGEDIHRHRTGLPVRGRPNTVFYRTGKFLRRNALVLSAAAAVVIVLVGLVVFSR